MPAISMFYGLIVPMFFMDTQQHYLPHVHVEYQGKEAVVSIPDGEILAGGLPSIRVAGVVSESNFHLSLTFTNHEKLRFDMRSYLDLPAGLFHSKNSFERI